MTSRDIVYQRLINQGLIHSTFTSVESLVRHMGCIQSQDFAGAKWAIGNRVNGITEADIDKLFSAGKLLRTHVLRPTWHFICPEDIRWMLKLTAPRIKASAKSMHKKMGLDDAILKRSKNILTKALEQHQQLTRNEIKLLLQKGKLKTDDMRLVFYLLDAELDGVICSGPRQGKQFTYALLDKRAPRAKALALDRDDSLAELGKRYFTSHGPATLHDFAWWSGLNLVDVKRSIEINKDLLEHVLVDKQEYWFIAGTYKTATRKQPPDLFLLPPYDEYTVSYKDRTTILSATHFEKTGNGIFKPVIVINGKIAGTWQRRETKENVQVEIMPLDSFSKQDHRLTGLAAIAYAKFINKALI